MLFPTNARTLLVLDRNRGATFSFPCEGERSGSIRSACVLTACATGLRRAPEERREAAERAESAGCRT